MSWATIDDDSQIVSFVSSIIARGVEEPNDPYHARLHPAHRRPAQSPAAPAAPKPLSRLEQLRQEAAGGKN
ncbi:MAG: hypothetical protein JNG86_04725 [Verrucomicrobiaceae bacterium]|nr:hypothetical protein [Verrucomicrobiaceae bacterium]